MVCVYFLCSSRAEIVWFELHASVSPAYCSIWLLPDLPWKVSCLSSEWVWYIHAAYTTSSWPAALTLCASLVVPMTYFASCNTQLTADTNS